MVISPERIGKLLMGERFFLELVNEHTGEIRLSRPSLRSDLFEHISIICYGQGGGTVGSSSLVSVLEGPIQSGDLSVKKYHDELCSTRYESTGPTGRMHVHHYSRLESPPEALAWEQ